MKKFLIGAGIISGGIFYIIIGLLGLAIHLWTIAISFFYGGIFSAIIALSLPFIAELFWFFKSWGITGTFFNTYTSFIAAYVVLSISTLLAISFLSSKMDSNTELEKEEPFFPDFNGK